VLCGLEVQPLIPTDSLPMPDSSAALSVRDVVAAYLRHSVAVGLHCPKALDEQVRTLGLFVALHGDKLVTECKGFHLADWVESNPKWHSIATKRKRAATVKAAFNWASVEERIDRNPFRNVQYAEAERRPDMPDDVFERLCQTTSKPYERVLRFLRFTGCRLGEACEARWKDFDFAKAVWTIHKHKSRRFKRKVKIVPLVPQAVALLRSILYIDATALFVNVDIEALKPQPDGHVFRNERGMRWTETTLGRKFRRLRGKLRKLGFTVDATMHGVRHRVGSCAVANGAPLKLVAQFLGHASANTTERYYCTIDGEIEAIRAAAILGMPK
jgi:integrase